MSWVLFRDPPALVFLGRRKYSVFRFETRASSESTTKTLHVHDNKSTRLCKSWSNFGLRVVVCFAISICSWNGSLLAAQIYIVYVADISG